MAAQELNPNITTNDLLLQILKSLNGEGIPVDSPQGLAYIFCKTSNDATATARLGKYGITYQQHTSLQDGIDEFMFNADAGMYLRLFADIVGNGEALYLSRSRLPIQGALGSITVATSSPSTLVRVSGTCTGTKAQVASNACTKVTVRNDPLNSNDYIYVGDTNGQTFPLGIGESMDFTIANTNMLYVKAKSGTQYYEIIGA